jgi:hypothetical protein
MLDVPALLERQAAWQRGRAALPWAVKLRMAVIMRETQRALRASAASAHSGDLSPQDRRGSRKP